MFLLLNLCCAPYLLPVWFKRHFTFFFDSLVPHVTGVLFCHSFHCEFTFSDPSVFYGVVQLSQWNPTFSNLSFGQTEFVIFKAEVLCFAPGLCSPGTLQPCIFYMNNETNWWSWNVCTTPARFVCICHCGMRSNTENPLLASCIHFQRGRKKSVRKQRIWGCDSFTACWDVSIQPTIIV